MYKFPYLHIQRFIDYDILCSDYSRHLLHQQFLFSFSWPQCFQIPYACKDIPLCKQTIL